MNAHLTALGLQIYKRITKLYTSIIEHILNQAQVFSNVVQTSGGT
jgi:hypothetical protein